MMSRSSWVALCAVCSLGLAAGCERGGGPAKAGAAASSTAGAAAPAAAPGERSVEVVATLTEPTPGCLNQAVKDLGMSPKREGRTWTIPGTQVHAKLAQTGKMVIHFDPPDGAPVTAKISVRWDDPTGETASLEGTLQERAVHVLRKIGQSCDQPQPSFECTLATPSDRRPCSQAS